MPSSTGLSGFTELNNVFPSILYSALLLLYPKCITYLLLR